MALLSHPGRGRKDSAGLGVEPRSSGSEPDVQPVTPPRNVNIA
jgi:hypothetical protein